jgi:hypothetical protein
MGKANHGQKPPRPAGKVPEAPVQVNYDEETPKFCLRYLRPHFDVHALTDQRKAAFAKTLQKLSALTWKQLLAAPRHGQGFELLPVSQIKPTLPPQFDGQAKVMVFRYDGRLPMAGIRANDIYHVLWIEPEFNQLYDHDS